MMYTKLGLLLAGGCFLCLPGSSPAAAVDGGARAPMP